MAKKKQENLLDQAVQNINLDRETASDVLIGLQAIMEKSDENYKFCSAVAAKLIETLQRSNEQLIRISLQQEKQSEADQSLSDVDKDKLFSASEIKKGLN